MFWADVPSMTKSRTGATLQDVLPSGVKASPQRTDPAGPSSSSPVVFANTPLVKPPVPAPVSHAPRECRQEAKPTFLSPPRAPPPGPAPSEPFAVNPSESASPPPQQRSALLYPQGAPLGRVRIRRSERHPEGRAQDVPPEVAETWSPHDQLPGSQMYKGALTVGPRGLLPADP